MAGEYQEKRNFVFRRRAVWKVCAVCMATGYCEVWRNSDKMQENSMFRVKNRNENSIIAISLKFCSSSVWKVCKSQKIIFRHFCVLSIFALRNFPPTAMWLLLLLLGCACLQHAQTSVTHKTATIKECACIQQACYCDTACLRDVSFAAWIV